MPVANEDREGGSHIIMLYCSPCWFELEDGVTGLDSQRSNECRWKRAYGRRTDLTPLTIVHLQLKVLLK